MDVRNQQKMVSDIRVKELEVLALIERIESLCQPDLRWSAIAKTDIERGFMALVRSVE